MEGLDLMEVSAALPVSSYFRPQVLLHIHLQAWAMRKLESISDGTNRKETRKIPRKNLIALAKRFERIYHETEAQANLLLAEIYMS